MMFGSSHRNDSNTQDNSINEFSGDPALQTPSAPSLPTMGGQGSPFGPTPTSPIQTSSSDPLATQPPQVDHPIAQDNQVPHHEDTSHMVEDHGTPDPIDFAEQHDASSPAPTGDLVDIKQQALSQLSPLVSHLDQSAEEKFRTTMMMIQATDDQSLLQTAYDAAQKIEDDKARAQALLDVINEINYFTQQSK